MVAGVKLRFWSFASALMIFAGAGGHALAQEDLDPALGDPESGIVPQEEVPSEITPAEQDEPSAIPQPADSLSNVAGDMARESAELERIRADLQKARAEREAKAQQETKVLSTLNRLDAELSLKQRLLSGLERKESRLATDLQSTRADLERARMKLDERRNILRARLRNIYKMGEKPGLQVLLGATSAVDLMRRFDWLLLVANQDKRLFEDVQESPKCGRSATNRNGRRPIS
jgi:peptidoglycan hydrolase CwlO-like protein